MNIIKPDIKDDEIRVIVPDNKSSVEPPKKNDDDKSPGPKPKWKLWLIVTAVVLFGAIVVFFWWEVKSDPKEYLPSSSMESPLDDVSLIQAKEKENRTGRSMSAQTRKSTGVRGFVAARDTVVGRLPVTILTPENTTARLVIGPQALTDSAAVMVQNAASTTPEDEILGAFVYKGNLVSRGNSQAGFCAIIDGRIFIGVDDATPYLDKAIESEGYFFRQYPLVVGGKTVDNDLPYSSYRRALAQLDGEIVLIIGYEKQTLKEFARSLVELGVTTAIYVTGGNHSPGFYVNSEGKKIDFGTDYNPKPSKSNYIVWDYLK